MAMAYLHAHVDTHGSNEHTRAESSARAFDAVEDGGQHHSEFCKAPLTGTWASPEEEQTVGRSYLGAQQRP
jgi:hypothetical protein